MVRNPLAVVSVCALLLAVLAGSCVRTPSSPPAAATATAAPTPVMAQSSVTRNTAPQASAADLRTAAQSVNAFGFDLYQTLAVLEQNGNLFFSPYSLSAALAMVYAGAAGQTADQMAATLHFTQPQEQLHPALNALDLALVAPGQPFTLTVASAAWGQEGFPFRPAYLDLLAENYGAGVRLVDFRSPAERESARTAANEWAAARTNDKIRDLISPDLLNEFTRLILANTIYFKGDWASPFEAGSTRPQPFTRLDGSKVDVPMMKQRGAWVYAEGPDYQAVELPYKGERIRMLAILPRAGRLVEFERSLDAAALSAILAALKQEDDLALSLPKFKFEASYKLEQVLPQMGMRDVFDPDRADLSGMAEPGSERLFVAHVVHKAFVAVDEKGTEAAAASAVIAEAVSMPKTAVFDRPFLFLIRDRQTGVILFAGRLADPSAT